MLNNTEQHISSAASSVELDPKTTSFPTTTTDVQKMANLIQPHAIGKYEDMKATTTKMGILRIATEAEVLTGTVGDAIVTPATLQAKWIRPDASTTVKGLMRYATVAERAEASAHVSIGMNTAGVWDIVRTKALGTASVAGSLKLSTTAIGNLGTDNTTATTPLVVKAMIDKFAVTSTPAGATELVTGMVKISPSPIVNGSLHNGVAVSPKGFIETRASQSRVGTVKMATQAESNARTAVDVALSPATLPIASTSQFGITSLLDTPTNGANNKALSAHGAFVSLLSKTGGTLTGPLIAPSFRLSQAQGTTGDSVARKDYVDTRDAALQTQINTKVTTGTQYKRLKRDVFSLFWSNGGMGSGDFVLSDEWSNYDGIIFEGSGDDRNGFFNKSFDKFEFTHLNNAYKNYMILNTDSSYWYGKFATDNRTFKTFGENCRLWRVWGYRDVFVQA